MQELGHIFWIQPKREEQYTTKRLASKTNESNLCPNVYFNKKLKEFLNRVSAVLISVRKTGLLAKIHCPYKCSALQNS